MKKVACRYARRYKARRAPKCGCVTCELKWASKERSRLWDLLTAVQLRLREEDAVLHAEE